MKWSETFFLRRLWRDEKGQTLVVVGLTLMTMFALAGVSVEVGHIYYAYQELVASTNAATLAAAQTMPNMTQANTNLVAYSSETSQLNANRFLQNDSISAAYTCSSIVSGSLSSGGLNVACQTPTSGSCGGPSSCNAIAVTQTATVHLWLGKLFGVPTVNLTAKAYASMRGGSDIPYNIAVILDTTNSMTAAAPTGDGCGSGATQINCAVFGLKTMLQNMDPCDLNTTCSTSTPYVDGTALYVFPPVNINDTTDDTTCPTSNPPIVPYSFINVTPSSQNLSLPSSTSGTAYSSVYAGTYDVQPFEDTYKANDTTTTLASGDALSSAVGYATSGTCKGLQAPGGEGTYYAQVIRAAQAALVSQQTSYPGSQNIMIILSDGDATACNSQANTAAGGNGSCSNGSQMVAVNCPAVTSTVSKGVTTVTCGSTSAAINGKATTVNCPPSGCTGAPLSGTGTSTTNSTGYESATYPSALGECGQAVQAAQLATQAGTTVYTVAMGSETSGGCLTDAHYTISSGSTYGAEAWPSGTHSGQPCNAIGAMASNMNTFFSDNTAGCAASGGNVNYTTMAEIFQAIANGLENSRLIPSSAY
ncbi:MAG: TadG family pilus assembly protein [Terracidiphilus sp.]